MAKELYVGHLSAATTEEDLYKLFSVMGVVTSVHLIIDPDTGDFKRCGYVRMAASVSPEEVVETLDGTYLIDQVITVSIARPQKPGMGAAAKTLAKKPWLKDKQAPRTTASASQRSSKPASTAAPRGTAAAGPAGRKNSRTTSGPKPGGRRTP